MEDDKVHHINDGHSNITKVQFDDRNLNDTKHSTEIQVCIDNSPSSTSDSPIVVKVHLGFLQINHKYEIKFSFDFLTRCPDSFSTSCSSPSSPSQINENFDRKKSAYSSNVQIIDFFESRIHSANDPSRTFQVKAHLFAYKEKYLKESVLFECNENIEGSSTKKTLISFVFYARVLSRDHGTPSLKNGIKCIGVQEDPELDDN